MTVDPIRPEAQALAVRGDTILAVGTTKEIEPYIGSRTEVIDLQGKLAVPGFIEGHGHFMGIGEAKTNLDLMKVKNWDEIEALVAEAIRRAEPGEWILGRGWHQEKWDKIPTGAVKGLPIHHSVSKLSPQNPVFLTHASGHACFANAKAMELAGVTRETPNPPGGEIVKDRRGNPIGVFRETAQRLIGEALAKDRARRSSEELEVQARKQAELAMQDCLSKGITSFQDAGASFETIDFLKKLAEEGKLRLRLYIMVREDNDRLAQLLLQYKTINRSDGRLTVRAIKRTIDGALGSHGAWLLEPYSDLPGSTGFNTAGIEGVTQTAELAIQHGFQLCVHAIGDRANREVLNIYEKIFQEHSDQEDLRWRIEHAQHLHAEDIPRFAQLGVIASMQAIHCTSDGPWVPKRLGEKRAQEGAYVWQKLTRSGAIVTNGTDAPVEDVDPIACFYASVSRKLNDETVFYPEQRMSREQALKSYTLNGAYAAFEEDIKGSLTVGKLADITVLSKDIMTIPEDEIRSARVLYTIVGGKVMYRAADN
ncbi:MAG: amidohydrolase [Acidobacteriota bacterium]